jgi:hypothetical protein
VRLPHTVLAGVQLQLSPRWDLGVTLRWLHWPGAEVADVRLSTAAADEKNVPERIPLYRGYRDSGLARGIGSYRRGPWRLGVGALAATPSVGGRDVSPAVVDGWQAGALVLAELQPTRWLALTAGYGARVMLPRTVSTSAFDPLYQVDCVQSRYDIPTCRLANRGRGAPTAAGDYASWTQELGASLTLAF